MADGFVGIKEPGDPSKLIDNEQLSVNGQTVQRQRVRSYPSRWSALGFQQVTSLSSSSALTVPAGTALAIIQCESQSVRWRDDGTAPTATVGMRMTVGAELAYDGDDAAFTALRFIEEASGAKLNVSYYGEATG